MGASRHFLILWCLIMIEPSNSDKPEAYSAPEEKPKAYSVPEGEPKPYSVPEEEPKPYSVPEENTEENPGEGNKPSKSLLIIQINFIHYWQAIGGRPSAIEGSGTFRHEKF